MFDLRWEHLEDGVALVHCDVQEWSLSVARKLDIAAGNLMDELEDKGYKTAYAVGPEHPKFCEYMGGLHEGTIIFRGKKHEVYKWVIQ